jgi:hypothetical protein
VFTPGSSLKGIGRIPISSRTISSPNGVPHPSEDPYFNIILSEEIIFLPGVLGSSALSIKMGP